MSSKRGRKRNDNLPPNRARDVQRAFRARRASHLIALEQRVQELEEENDSFRVALNLPPANRPMLGKGPTGKDKAKPYMRSSRADSPATTTTSTSSPHSIPAANPNMDSNQSWDNVVLPEDEQPNMFQHPQSTARSSLSPAMYMPTFNHPNDRPFPDFFNMRTNSATPTSTMPLTQEPLPYLRRTLTEPGNYCDYNNVPFQQPLPPILFPRQQESNAPYHAA